MPRPRPLFENQSGRRCSDRYRQWTARAGRSRLDVMSVVHRGEAARPTCHKKHEGCSGGPSRASTHEGRTMGKYSEVFVGIDTAKSKHAVAIADTGRDGETRYLGEIDSAPATVERVIKKLASK